MKQWEILVEKLIMTSISIYQGHLKTNLSVFCVWYWKEIGVDNGKLNKSRINVGIWAQSGLAQHLSGEWRDNKSLGCGL